MANIDIADLRRSHALLAVEGWLLHRAGGARKLSDTEIGVHRGKRSHGENWRGAIVAGWRLGIEFPDGIREVDVLFDRDYPWSQPRVAFLDSASFLKIPHVESDGAMCLLPGHAEVDPEKPVDVMQRVLAEASKLIDDNAGGATSQDFRDEFISYWQGDDDSTPIRSLFTPASPTRTVKVWRGKSMYLIGDDPDRMLQWLENFSGKLKGRDRELEDGVLLWLDDVLLPDEYPRNAADVLNIAARRTVGGEAILREAVNSAPDKLVVILGASTANGAALAAVTILKPRAESRGKGRAAADPISKGFRPGMVPAWRTQSVMLGGRSIIKSRVSRVDAAWIHGRDRDVRQARLNDMTVALIGCGSVGSSVAALLAQAGVGNLSLIDPDYMAWPNVGRHELGATDVGGNKAERLGKKLARDYPHMDKIVSQPHKWQNVERKNPECLTDADLIISTVGSWGVEGMLNSWHVSGGREKPIIYGWTEPHALAGQAVAITASSGCLACGMVKVGIPSLRVTEWPERGAQHQEPACGAVFQPYGAIELSYVIATISNLALDTLLGRVTNSTVRIWCANRVRLVEAGGEWTKEWQAIAGDRDGDFVKELPWAKSRRCEYCHGAL